MTVPADLRPDVRVLFPGPAPAGSVLARCERQAELDSTWDSLSERQRAAMTVMVSEGLRRLADTVEAWLPGDVKLDQSADYVIEVTWKNRHLDRVIVEMLAMASADHVRRIDELRDLAGGGVGADTASG